VFPESADLCVAWRNGGERPSWFDGRRGDGAPDVQKARRKDTATSRGVEKVPSSTAPGVAQPPRSRLGRDWFLLLRLQRQRGDEADAGFLGVLRCRSPRAREG